jgi:hypothetical protein
VSICVGFLHFGGKVRTNPPQSSYFHQLSLKTFLKGMTMNQFDSALTMYAKSGLRSIADWTERGRNILNGAVARLEATHRGTSLPLYSRDQTQIRPSLRAERQAY